MGHDPTETHELQSTVPTVHPAVSPESQKSRLGTWKRTVQIGVGVGIAVGVAVGATAIATAATSPSNPSTGSNSSQKQPSSGHHFGFGHGFGPRAGGFAGIGGFGGFGQVVHGEFTVKGPSGYETMEVQSGTVTSLKDVSGSTWTLVVTSADKTVDTYTVNSGTSVNGGETGISSVKTGDNVSVVALLSKGTATVKNLMDTSRLSANHQSWAGRPGSPGTPPNSSTPPASGPSSSSTSTS
jgi:hypothetical protein